MNLELSLLGHAKEFGIFFEGSWKPLQGFEEAGFHGLKCSLWLLYGEWISEGESRDRSWEAVAGVQTRMVVGWATIRTQVEQVDRRKICFGIRMNRRGVPGCVSQLSARLLILPQIMS